MKVRRSRYLVQTAELNITAFLNLMVILVPFLLITAVFSKMTVIELNLPALDSKADAQEAIDLQLQLFVKNDGFDIRDANLGSIQYFNRSQGDTDWQAFSNVLVEIKSRFPEETSIEILLSHDVPYKTLIRVMDQVRSAEIVQVGTLETVELFPDVSVGDIPEDFAQTKPKANLE